VIQMRHEGGTDLDDEGPQLGVLGARDQDLVDGVQDCLVIRHLVVEQYALSNAAPFRILRFAMF